MWYIFCTFVPNKNIKKTERGMIFVRDKGRLCNNILQYGHLYAWAREHGRQTVSMRFAYKYQWFHICHTRHHHWLTYLFAKYGGKMGLLPVVSFDEPEADYHREEQQLLQRSLVIAQGWYARWYDLFLKYKAEIVALFQFDDAVKQAPDQLLAAVPSDHLRLGMHIRRGDYRTWNNGRYYYTDEQYIEQIKRFQALHPHQSLHVFICGNDPELNEAAFAAALPDVTLTFAKGNPAEDLYLLSQCHWLMGPPSTFTLVASMYHDVPLYWIHDAEKAFTDVDFKRFDEQFRHIV